MHVIQKFTTRVYPDEAITAIFAAIEASAIGYASNAGKTGGEFFHTTKRFKTIG